ncbi:MAG: hypothetical protein WCS87_06400 [Methylococcaceae bacterium]
MTTYLLKTLDIALSWLRQAENQELYCYFKALSTRKPHSVKAVFLCVLLLKN